MSVVYHAQAAHAFNAEIKYPQCMSYDNLLINVSLAGYEVEHTENEYNLTDRKKRV